MKQLFHKSQCHFPLQICTVPLLRAYIFLVTKHTCPHSSCAFNSSVKVSRCSHHYCGLQLSVNIIQYTEPFCHCRCSKFQTEQQLIMIAIIFLSLFSSCCMCFSVPVPCITCSTTHISPVFHMTFECDH